MPANKGSWFFPKYYLIFRFKCFFRLFLPIRLKYQKILSSFTSRYSLFEDLGGRAGASCFILGGKAGGRAGSLGPSLCVGLGGLGGGEKRPEEEEGKEEEVKSGSADGVG